MKVGQEILYLTLGKVESPKEIKSIKSHLYFGSFNQDSFAFKHLFKNKMTEWQKKLHNCSQISNPVGVVLVVWWLKRNCCKRVQTPVAL